jgi:nitrate/nitrite transport system permease protein
MLTKIKHSLLKFVDITALGFLEPIVRLCFGDQPQLQVKKILQFVVVPIVAFLVFLGLWWVVADNVVTKSGKVPTPPVVWATAMDMWTAHNETRASQRAFYVESTKRVAELEQQLAQIHSPANLAEIAALEQQVAELKASGSPRAAGKERVLQAKQAQMAALESQIIDARKAQWSGAPTYLDQIWVSLETVFFGFAIATMIAVPIGILCGVSKIFMAAMTPLISLFKPVSPIVWLPICGIIVGAYVNAETSTLQPAFVSSAITVALCSLWPTLVNTALGVSSIDRDHINVARVLRLGWWDRLTKIIIPSALPLIFTGLRISLGVGWMVLIAAELLATNPGLGKFVWDAFQNGSSQTFAQMFVAVFTVGIIGLLLDRIMIVFQRLVTFDRGQAAAAL